MPVMEGLRMMESGQGDGPHKSGWARLLEVGPAWITAITGIIVALTAAGFFVGHATAGSGAATPAVTVTVTKTLSPSGSASPSADAPTTATAETPTTSGSAPVAGGSALVTYIEDLQAASGSQPYDTQGVAEVSGVSYPHSQGAQFCFGSNERQWVYVLGRKYASFQAVLGLSDNSVADAEIQFTVLADKHQIYSKDLQIGQKAVLDVPVRNTLQLELDTTLLTQDGGCGGATGEWANARAVGA
jgi:NPCBM/NEW2 domain